MMDFPKDLRPSSAQDLRCGTSRLCPLTLSVRAGPITCRYEDGDLRDIQVAGSALIQRLYVGVRDHRWATIPGSLSDIAIDVQPRSFRISYTAVHRQDAVAVRRTMLFTGAEDGTIHASLEADILNDFPSNRLGFCVLHPTQQCAGMPVTVVHSDGTTEHGRFPQAVTAKLPFTDISVIRQAITPDCTAEIALVGDIFEMEDQRPYSDASFKTYSRVQSRPKPMRLATGMRIQQTVTIRVLGQPPAPVPRENPIIRIGTSLGPMLPQIGLGFPLGVLDSREQALIAALRPAHILVRLSDEMTSLDHLRAAVSLANHLHCSMQIVLLSEGPSLEKLTCLADLARHLAAPVASWVVVPRDGSVTTAALLSAARRLLAPATPMALIGGGTIGYVQHLLAADLPPGCDLVSVAIHPQVHATDTSTLFDNLMSHGNLVTTLTARVSPAQLAIGPISIAPTPTDATIPADPRQCSLAAAAWTCASISHMAQAGLISGTWSHTHGHLGVVLPADHPRAAPGVVTPLYLLLAALADFFGATTIESSSTSPSTVAVLAVSLNGRRRILIANLTPSSQQVTVVGCPGAWLQTVLDEANTWAAMQESARWSAATGEPCSSNDGRLTVNLRPYALAYLDPAQWPL